MEKNEGAHLRPSFPGEKWKWEKSTRKKFWINVMKMILPEILLALFYLYGIVFFVAFQDIMPYDFQKVLANIAIVLLIIVPVFTLTSLYHYYLSGKMDESPNKTLIRLKKQGTRFTTTRYISLGLNLILFLLCILTVPSVYSEHLTRNEMSLTFLIGSLIMVVLSGFLWKYYNKQIKKNENMMAELE